MAEGFYELVVKGSFDRTKAFVVGYLAGRGAGTGRPKVFFSRECGIRQEKLPEKIVEWAGLVRDRVHVVLEADLLAGLRAALRKHGSPLGLEVVVAHRIDHAALSFRFRCYSRGEGQKILRRFQRLPAGLRMRPGYRPRETVRPEARGPEMYAPSHDYELVGRGTVEGPVDRVVRFRERLEEIELVETGRVSLARA